MSKIDHRRWWEQAHHTADAHEEKLMKIFRQGGGSPDCERDGPTTSACVRSEKLEEGNEKKPNQPDLIVKNNVQKRTVDYQTDVVVHET